MKTFAFIYIAFILAMITGWIMNLVDLYHGVAGNELILRVAGIFVAPLGAFMGLFV